MNWTTNSGDPLRIEAERIVTQFSGTKPVQVTRVDAGVMTFKYCVESWGGHRYIVRFYPQNRGAVVRYEPAVIRLCRERGMRVPKVIASSQTGPKASLEYMVYRMIPGTSMQSRLVSISQQSLRRICAELIDELRILNEIEIDGFGDLVDSGRAKFGSWLSFVERTFVDGIAFARAQDVLPRILLDQVELIGQHLERFTYSGPPSLSWGDVSPGNVIIGEGDEIAGLIDFEGVLSGDFHLSLGFLRARYAGSSFYKTVAESWPDGHDEATSARSALYVIVRALRLASFALEPLPTGIQRDRLETFLPGLNDAVDESLRWIGERSLVWQH
jgi:aminoglycoside phosphotransferase (APT) family kinase protein